MICVTMKLNEHGQLLQSLGLIEFSIHCNRMERHIYMASDDPMASRPWGQQRHKRINNLWGPRLFIFCS